MKLRARDEISPEEEAALRSALGEPQDVAADTKIVRANEPLETSTLLLDGIACRYKDLKNGERQITELHVAGDFVDLHSFTLKRLDHDIMTLTRCRTAKIPHDALRRITENFPHLTRVFWFATNLDASIHREWELSLGRRSAAARVAHFFCEMYMRLEIVGLAREHSYALPITQTDIAECLGLTSIHVNRVLKTLREKGLVLFRDGVVSIQDWEALCTTAEFSDSYLYLERRDR